MGVPVVCESVGSIANAIASQSSPRLERFFDVPAKFLMREMARLYPKLCRPGGLRGPSMEEEGALADGKRPP